MPIFNHKVIQKHIAAVSEIPEHDLKIINAWAEQINNGSLAGQTEVAIHSPFTQQIMVKLLGYAPYGESDQWTIAREYGVAAGSVDLALGHFSADKSSDVVAAPFELKGAKTKDLDAIMSGRHKTPVQQAWEYAKDIKGAEWVLVSNYIELRLYAVSETSLVYEKFHFKDLIDPAEYAKFKLLLSPENLLGGKTQSILKESLAAEKEISDRLYTDYKYLRESMLTRLISDNPEQAPAELIAPAQKLLDRVLFVAFAEDKGLIPDTTIKQAFEHNDPYNPKPVYQNFIGLFNAIDNGNKSLDIPAYNGGLFARDEFLDNLIVSDSLCEGFKNLAEYDFDSEVSVTVLGHIFEQSIADLEELSEVIHTGSLPRLAAKAKATAVSGKRKKHGVVYTPDNITRFIVLNTLGTHIDEQFEKLFSEYGQYKADQTIQWKQGKQTELRFWYAWQERLQQIKVVDPACGSGAFLVAAFDYLYAEYEKTNHRIAELTGQRSVLDLNKEILNNNLYGVDINEESIEITKLSLWLKTAERGKPLESLDANFIAGNSLGFDAPAPGSEFVWQNSFKSIFQQGGFDVVLGNPPYVRQELLGDIKPWLEQNYSVYHGVLDLYGYFFELGSKLLKADGRMAYISSSTFFKTGSGENLRHYLSHEVALEKIVDFGDIQVFEGVTTYPAILVLQNKKPASDHKIEILTLKDALPENLQLAFEQQKSRMAHSQLGRQSWQLEDESLHALRKKLTGDYPTLKQVYGSPYRGVLTGLNEAFVIDRQTRDAIVQQDPKSAEIIKPFLEGKDLKRWHSQTRDVWLIAMPKSWIRTQLAKSKDETITEDEAWQWLNSNHPALAEWLLPFTSKGRKRGDKGEFWWELRACAYYEEFDKPKIQYGHFSPGSLFHYNTNGAYSNDKSYIIPTEDLFLYGLLNSNAYWYLIKSMCPFVRGGFYEVRAQYIETLPIPDKPENEEISVLAENTQTKTEARYACEQGFARRLEDVCPPDQVFKLNKKLQSWWRLDFAELQKELKKAFNGSISLAERNEWYDYFEAEKARREALNSEVIALEVALNQQVYALFKLSQAEIALIEA
ncbi:MAG: N-6 DNA methylase [Gammaproteobacteria bacterium]|jgi:hypothetical protein|nr:N-6 DNA methylase [Gammaproteobacteria bacterium]